MLTKRQFTGKPFDGIIHQKAQRVEAPGRGIVFDRPDRYIVNTPVGQLEIGVGDWVVEFLPSRRYVIRAEDMAAPQPQQNRKWWQLWR